MKQQSQTIKEPTKDDRDFDRILHSPSLVTITQIAKDYGMSGTAFNKLLHELKIQYKQNGQWLLYSKYQNKGYTHSKTILINQTNGTTKTILSTQWTQAGRAFIYHTLKKKRGLVPTAENL